MANDISTLGIQIDSRQISAAIRALGQLENQSGETETATKKLSASYGKFKAGIGGAVNAVFSLQTAVAGLAGGAFVGLASSAGSAARELENFSRLTGVGTSDFQKMAAATATVGISAEKFADQMKDVQDKVGDFISTGGGAMADFFENIAPKVGVTAEHFRNLSGPDALQLYVSSLEKANLSQSEMTFYMEAIASDSTALLPLLRDNGAAMQAMGDQIERTGLYLNDLDVDRLLEVDKSFKQIQRTISTLSDIFVSELSPYIKAIADNFDTAAVNAHDFRNLIHDSVAVGAEFVGVFLDAGRAMEIAAKSGEVLFETIGIGFGQTFDLVRLFGLGEALDLVRLFGVGLRHEFEEAKLAAASLFNAFLSYAEKAINHIVIKAREIPGFGDLEMVKFPRLDTSEYERDLYNLKVEYDTIQAGIGQGFEMMGEAWAEVGDLMLKELPSEELKRRVAEIRTKAENEFKALGQNAGKAIEKGIIEGTEQGLSKAEQEALDAHNKELETLKGQLDKRYALEQTYLQNLDTLEKQFLLSGDQYEFNAHKTLLDEKLAADLEALDKKQKEALDAHNKELETLKGQLDKRYVLEQTYLQNLATLEKQFLLSGDQYEFNAHKALLDEKLAADLEALDKKQKEEKKAADESAQVMKDAYESVFAELDKHVAGLGKTLSSGMDVMANGLTAQNGMGVGVGMGQMLGGIGGNDAGYAGVGSSIGAAIGMATPLGPLGAAIGGAIGGLIGGFIGPEESDKTQVRQLNLATGRTTSEGSLLEDKFSSANDAAVQSAIDSVKMLANAVEEETGAALNGVIELAVGSRDGIDLMIDGVQVLDNYTGGIVKAMDYVFESMLDQAGITTDIYKQLAADGEGFVDAYIRLEAQLTSVQGAAALLGTNFDYVGTTGIIAADALVQAAGGLEAFVAETTFFYNNFFTQQEKFEKNLAGLTGGMDSLNLSLPSTREAFKDLVVGMDLTTGKGRDTYAALMDLVPAADAYYTQIEAWETELTKLYGDLLEREPDAAGLEHWLTQLESGAITIDEVAAALANSDEAAALLTETIDDTTETATEAEKAVDGVNRSLDEGAGAAINFGESVRDAVEKMKALTAEANAFAGGIARDVLLSGMSAEEQAIFKLKEWRIAAEDQLQEYIDSGVTIFGGSKQVLADIETLYNARLLEIQNRYAETAEANTFAGGIARDVLLSDMSAEEQAIFKLKEWRIAAEDQLQEYIDSGAIIFGGSKQVLADIETLYNARLLEIQNRYAESAEETAEVVDAVRDYSDELDGLNDLYSDGTDALTDYANRMGGFADSLREYGRGLLTGDLSPLSPAAQYQQARSQFGDISRRAMAGDEDAISQLQAVSETLLQESRSFQGSGGTYASDFNMVQSALTTTADMADRAEAQANRQLELLQAQVDQSKGLQTEVQTLTGVVNILLSAQQEAGLLTVAELRKQTDALDGLKSNSDLQVNAA